MSSKKDKTKPINNYYMGLALALARENAGLTKENPSAPIIEEGCAQKRSPIITPEPIFTPSRR